MANPISRQDTLAKIKALIDSNVSDDQMMDRLYSLLPNKCPVITENELASGVNLLQDSFAQFVSIEDPDLTMQDIDINSRNLAEVVCRVYKRMEYYRYFHNIDNVSELKRTALNAFWLIKLKPFTVLRNDSPLRVSPNEKFALNLILAQIQYLVALRGSDFEMPEQCFIQDTLYAFKYRDLTKEALILFVDGLAKTYGITIDSWI